MVDPKKKSLIQTFHQDFLLNEWQHEKIVIFPSLLVPNDVK